MNKKKSLELLKIDAENLMHRNIKQKDELLLKIKNHLTSYKYKKEIVDKFNLIIFEYVELYKGFHSYKRHDDTWKIGKRDLITFLNSIE